MDKKTIKISVRNLVEFILREGDIDNRQGRGASPDAMLEGGRIHRKIQRMMGVNYHAEVPLSIEIDEGDYLLVIEGRADGILIECEGDTQFTAADNYNHIKIPEGARVTIDEIKGVYRNLNTLNAPVGVHRAQAMCYAYIYALKNDLAQITVQMTYCNLDTEEIKRFTEEFDFAELLEWFDKLKGEYRKWADFESAHHAIRQESIKNLKFPYPYRKGQKELAADVYATIKRGKNLFIQAPTGAGKTLSTVFPAVKAVGEELSDKIFYLTAKTITGNVAQGAFSLLRKSGYQAKIVRITAKEKLCMCEQMDCNPVNCPYAKGHYDRINDAVFDLLNKEDMFTREVILEQAKDYTVCPFELNLDIASWADDIICDYNYVFDPNVCLKRFFAEGTKGDYIFLVDEAHNLVDRSREMYSATLVKEDLLEAKKYLKKYDAKLATYIDRCNRIMLGYKRKCDKYEELDDVGELIFALMRLSSRLDEFLQKHVEFPERKAANEFYFKLRFFMNIGDLADENYVIYSEHDEDGRFRVKLFCVDPSRNLQRRIDTGNATIFFSATLLPIDYYKNLLSEVKDNYAVYAETSFSPDQHLILIANDVSSKYTRRNITEFERIARYIRIVSSAKKGNYIAFFPSYKMMREVYDIFEIEGPNISIAIQKPGMTEAEREEFLDAFSEERSKERGNSFVAFCVMGGIFGEGIDLKNEQLIGAIIVGTGLPQIGNEREILKRYYDRRSGEGFNYAYLYPGMNKVLQAAGRVIRTVDDRGVIALLDDRFLRSDYTRLFPREWDNVSVCNVDNAENYMNNFWKLLRPQ
jgi:Rad3-related DNA helicase